MTKTDLSKYINNMVTYSNTKLTNRKGYPGKGTMVMLQKKNSNPLMIYINSIYIFTFNIKVMTGGN
jgi:hypothetical protein